MARSAVLVFVLLCLVALSTAKKGKLNDSQLLMNMYGECLAVCEEITESTSCPDLCDFVNHLYNHDATVFREYRTLLEEDPDVTEFGLKDTIYKVMHTKTEDRHELALYFRDALIRWGDYKTAHPEPLGSGRKAKTLQ